MSQQNITADLFVNLSAEQQEVISGGGGGYCPCYKPKKCCGEDKAYKEYTSCSCSHSYPGVDDSDGY